MKANLDQSLRRAASLSARGSIAEAEDIYRTILAKFPQNKRAQCGIQGLSGSPAIEPSDQDRQALIALYNHGRLAELLVHVRPLIGSHPSSVFLHNIAGAAQAGTGQFEAAVDSYGRAIQLKPDFADAYSNRGVALQELGRPAEALASFDKAIQLYPDFVEAHSNRGNVLKQMKRLEEALKSCDTAIRLNPDYAEAHSNRGLLLRDLKRPQEALDSCDTAIWLKPDFVPAHANRGNALQDLNRLEDAAASYEHAIRLKPDYAEAYSNRGVVLRELGRLAEAIDSYDTAIRLKPYHADAFYNRGNALQDLKRLDEAADDYEQALRLGSDQAEVRNQLLYQRARMCRWTDDEAAGLSTIGIDTDSVTPFAMLILEDAPLRHLQRATAFSRQRYPHIAIDPPVPDASQTRRRIGYFSADFYDHATMYLMARLFEAHDRTAFDIHIFSYGPDRQDAMRHRLMQAADAFHDVRDLSDRAIADLARDRSIDIAIDLKGHTQYSRSGIFAHRAAPIQINYLGYPGSMGADFIDYIIADRIVIPAASRAFYSEKILYLPGSYQVNDDERLIAETTPGRQDLGLPETGFVFCSFNNSYKISRAEFDIWMRLLSGVDGSVLWLLNDNPWAVANLRREAEARGIDAARLVFADRVPLPDHLARHRCADLFLDTFNVNAHTTASDALWAGLPVVTRLGESFAARVAGSLLHAVGMPDLVTDTAEAYEHLALDLAMNPDKLAAVKARLAANRSTTPLFDTTQFTRHLERGYMLAFDRCVRGLQPDHIEVPANASTFPQG